MNGEIIQIRYIIKKECKIEDNTEPSKYSIYNMIIQKISNRLIYESEENRINFRKIESLRILDIKSEKVVIVDKNFLKIFLSDEIISLYTPIRFYAYNKIITFFLENEKIFFNTDDNIISKDEYQNQNIKI